MPISNAPAASSSCNGLPSPANQSNLQSASVLRLPNGVYLEICLGFKAGFTDWSTLITTLVGSPPLHSKSAISRVVHYIPYWRAPSSPRFTASASTCGVTRVMITRNPYERMLSYWLDKVRDSCNSASNKAIKCKKTMYWPHRLPPNASFPDAVRHIANATTTANNYFAWLHYAPVSITTCARCVDNRARILKLEYVETWYSQLVAELGLAAVVSDVKLWRNKPGRCFQQLAGSCYLSAAVVETGNLATTQLRRDSDNPCPIRSLQHHVRAACHQMQYYYNAETAHLVTAYAQADLKAFHYPPWRGDVSARWF